MNCDYCFKPINGIYHYDIWGNNFHPKHIKKGEICKSCSCLIMPLQQTLKLDDGSQICKNCLPQSVLNNNQLDKCVKAVHKFYGMGKLFFNSIQINYQLVTDNNLSKDILGQYILSDNKYEIWIKKGLNKTVICGVLAHELMHVYLNLNNLKFSLQEEEGLCEVARYFTLKTIGDNLSKTLINIMEASDDPIYDHGFRLMRSRIINQGGNIQNFLKTYNI